MAPKNLVEIIVSPNPEVRDTSLDSFCAPLDIPSLLRECEGLEKFRRESPNLYERVRGLFFLYAIHRFHLPFRGGYPSRGRIPFAGYQLLLKRRFSESIDIFLKAMAQDGPNASISSALAQAYHRLGFQTLADQVRLSVRGSRDNQWMFELKEARGHPHALRPELSRRADEGAPFPLLMESTPVRMDLSHSGWSDIFFLGMDFPEGARVVNVSIDLAVRGGAESGPRPPIETFLRVIDEPVLRLTSVDLATTTDMRELAEVFDFAKDYLGLLKAGVIASGLVPPGLEGSGQTLAALLEKLAGKGRGLEIVSKVGGIPKGSRLAVSTNLLASLIALGMRATGQTESLTGQLKESERRTVAARAILGEWLGGSGGGWQDSGGVWPGIKLIHGVLAGEGDPEYQVSRGRLLPDHELMGPDQVSLATRQGIQDSLVLVHGGMAQDVGPVLEMVTERYLLRSGEEWRARQEAMKIFDHMLAALKLGDVESVGQLTHGNFNGPIQAIIPWAGNLYTEELIRGVKQEFGPGFLGFWMLGGMAGGGMGFLFKPASKPRALDKLKQIMSETKARMEKGVPFAMEPVVYDFKVNERGTWADLLQGEAALLPPEYYALMLPLILRRSPSALSRQQNGELRRVKAACGRDNRFNVLAQVLFDQILPPEAEPSNAISKDLRGLLDELGFDPVQHERIRADLKHGRIGLAQNRLPANSRIEDVEPGDVLDAAKGITPGEREIGEKALQKGEAAVVTLAGGAGSRWTQGAGVVKALNPFCRIRGRHRNFLEVHLAKCRQTAALSGTAPAQVFTTSYLTHQAISEWLAREGNYGYEGPLLLSSGRAIGLRLVPMVRDLRFAWEEMPQQILDQQAQKVQESLQTALYSWARARGEATDYADNLPLQCVHPVGHWYEVPNLLLNGTLLRLFEERPGLKHLMVHNIDTLGADLDPGLLGWHIRQNAALTAEVIPRHLEDRGGGLARVEGRLRLVEGMALPYEEAEFNLTYYNSATIWVNVEKLLKGFGLTRDDLKNLLKVQERVRAMAQRVPAYVTIKDVKKRWGRGQEDILPVCQFERLWGDMTALPEFECRYAAVSRRRGLQLKDPAELDGWLRDGSKEYLETLCKWE